MSNSTANHPIHYHPILNDLDLFKTDRDSALRACGLVRVTREEKYKDLEFPQCPIVSQKYVQDRKIGQGTFGEVYLARCRRMMDKVVALKKVIYQKDLREFPITTGREIQLLMKLRHENIVNLIEVCLEKKRRPDGCQNNHFYLVFDYCEHDLAGLLANSQVVFSLGDIKRIMQQLFEGLFFIHYNQIMHRDLKASNILVTKDGILKLADFGLSRTFNVVVDDNNYSTKSTKYTGGVVTLWYRAPEIILGDQRYGTAVDIWAAGCIMAELWTRTPILQGSKEQEQLDLISSLCGSITPEVWPDVVSLRPRERFELRKGFRRVVRDKMRIKVSDVHALDLLDRLLVLDPSRRLDADVVLNHDFFWKDPQPSDLRVIKELKQSMLEMDVKMAKAKMLQRPKGYVDQVVERVY